MSRPKRARAPRNFTLDLSGPSLALSAAGSSTDGRQIVHKGKAPEKMLFNNHDPAALLPEMSEKAKGKRKAVEKIGKEKQQLSGGKLLQSTGTMTFILRKQASSDHLVSCSTTNRTGEAEEGWQVDCCQSGSMHDPAEGARQIMENA